MKRERNIRGLNILNCIIIFFICMIISCGERMSKEVTPFYIKISGPMADKKQEISGMDWYENNLFLLPENLNGYVFLINKSDLDSRINKTDTSAITPQKIKFNTPDYKKILPGFDSFEAIAFRGYEVYISIEIRFKDDMGCVLARGHIDEETLEITIPEQTLIPFEVPTFVDNMSYESLVIKKNRVYALFEANGDSLIENPYVLSVNVSGKNIKKHPTSSINYRIADATRIDQYNRFWAINYHYPGDKQTLKPSKDLMISKYGEGPTHSKSERVERLVEYKINKNRVVLTGNPHIELELEGEKISRKWEALARYGNKGFLIATDKYPTTILAYVPLD